MACEEMARVGRKQADTRQPTDWNETPPRFRQLNDAVTKSIAPSCSDSGQASLARPYNLLQLCAMCGSVHDLWGGPPLLLPED